MIKKIFLVYLLFFGYSYQLDIYAFDGYTGSIKLDLSSNLKSISLGESLKINISITSDGTESLNGGVTIDGIEKFNINGQSTSTSMQLVGDNSFSETNITLGLSPNTTGYIELGPAKIQYGTGFLESNIINIDILEKIPNNNDNKITINNALVNKGSSYIMYLGPLVFLFMIIAFFRYIKHNIKDDEFTPVADEYISNVSNFNSLDDIINVIGKVYFENKLLDTSIKKEYDDLIYKINELKYSGHKESLDYTDMNKYLNDIYNLLK